MEVALANELECEQFKEQFSKFDYLWKKDLHTALQEFCEANGTTLPGVCMQCTLSPLLLLLEKVVVELLLRACSPALVANSCSAMRSLLSALPPWQTRCRLCECQHL